MPSTTQSNMSIRTENLRKQRKLASADPNSDGEESLGSQDTEYETETSDSSYVPPSKTQKNKKSSSTKRQHKRRAAAVESEEEYDSDEEEYDSDADREEVAKLQRIISKIFPSKYMTERAKSTSSVQKKKAKQEKTKKKVERRNVPASPKKLSMKSKSKNSRVYEIEDEEEEDYDEDYEEEEDSDEEDSDEEDSDEEDSDGEEEDGEGVYNIILALDGAGDEAEEDEYVDDDAECDSDDEEAFMKETFVRSTTPDLLDNGEATTKHAKKRKGKKRNTSDKEDIVLTDVEQEYLELVETKKQLTAQLVTKPNSKILKNAINECKDSINKLIKKARTKNAKTYHKLIHDDKKRTNEIDYFRKKLSNKEQLRVMHDLKEINKHINVDKPYRLALLDSKMPAKFKATAMQKLNVLRTMEPGDPEYYKIKNWVDTFMRIPFGMYRSLEVKMDDGIEVCNSFMTNAKSTLDNCVYGLNDAKIQIMQMMGQWISNPSAMGTAIAIKGPMGTGKTTLVKEGISKILGREFAFIALGGTGDSSFLEGHSYTYEGSSWGKIVQILIDSKCMNPVIYFDELDKISDTPRGEEIAGILTHLTDTSQNSQFHDKYFSEVDFDLSKCLFIFSYNDESKVNPILRDRMYRIQTKGYDSKEKVVIARKHLLPKIREQVNFSEEDVIIPDETIQHIVASKDMTNEEAGVRNLKRCLEIIYTKLNLFRLVKPEEKLFDKELDVEVSFPFTVTPAHVDKFIACDNVTNQSFLAMYV
jgi:ATP-dependent Lon protease